MRTILAAAILMGLSAGAEAACFDNIGRTGCTDSERFPVRDLRRLSCDNLWLVRNTIYDEGGLCFQTRAARMQFDNSDCTVNDPARVRMNRVERTNVSRIQQVEREKGCR